MSELAGTVQKFSSEFEFVCTQNNTFKADWLIHQAHHLLWQIHHSQTHRGKVSRLRHSSSLVESRVRPAVPNYHDNEVGADADFRMAFRFALGPTCPVGQYLDLKAMSLSGAITVTASIQSCPHYRQIRLDIFSVSRGVHLTTGETTQSSNLCLNSQSGVCGSASVYVCVCLSLSLFPRECVYALVQAQMPLHHRPGSSVNLSVSL